MKNIKLFSAAMMVAAAAFTVSCDKESLPDSIGSAGSNVTIGDGETSAFIVNGAIDGLVSDFEITYGDESITTVTDFGENSSAFNMNTGTNDLVITTTKDGEEIVIFNEQVDFNDETLYMFFVSNDEDGASYQVDVLEYSTEDFEMSDSEMYEYGLTGNNEDYYTVNGYNYAYGFEDGQLYADFTYMTGGEADQNQVAFGDYGSVTSFGLNKDGYYSDFDFNYFADEDSEFIEGENGEDLNLTTSLDNLNYNSNSNSNSQELANMFLVGNEENVELVYVDMSSLNVNYETMDVE